MKIEKGWRLYSADFSLQASGKSDTGTVTFIRSPEDKGRWHAWLTDEEKEDPNGPELYIHAQGKTIEEAILNANLKAAHALPIKEPMTPFSDGVN